MAQTVKALSSRLELDKAFQYAVTLAWEGLMNRVEPRSIRVEYLWEPGTALDHLSVWSVRARGYQDLVCDYWTRASVAHPSGTRFENQYHSDRLAQTIDFVMKNQDQFTRFADAGRHGLVQIYPPDTNDRREAAAWLGMVQATGSKWGAGETEVPVPLEDPRQDEEALSRMDDEGYSSERAASLPDATGYSDYEWSAIS